MNAKVKYIDCPEYNFDSLDLEKVSKCIDEALINNFSNKKVVIRGIQSKKHDLPKDKIVQQILEVGFDRINPDDLNQVSVSDKSIDLFGLGCEIKGSITLPILEGFHKWKPKLLEIPQTKVDIWMIYDANQLENIEYNHSYYKTKARDGYRFKDPKDKRNALIGMLIIN